jgi:hypothetical protein
MASFNRRGDKWQTQVRVKDGKPISKNPLVAFELNSVGVFSGPQHTRVARLLFISGSNHPCLQK